MTLTALTFVITDRGGRRVALIGPIAVAADRAVVGALDGAPDGLSAPRTKRSRYACSHLSYYCRNLTARFSS